MSMKNKWSCSIKIKVTHIDVDKKWIEKFFVIKTGISN